MTQSDFRTAAAGAALRGLVVYRCAGCGDLIHGLATFYDPEQDIYVIRHGAMTPTTRTYHPNHVPEGVTHGRS